MQNALNFSANIPFLVGHYNPVLVGVSILIAIVASYLAMRVCKQIKFLESQRWQFAWLVIGAMVLGVGVWAMHFIGMLAFKLPCAVSYAIGITLFSMLPSIVASGIALSLCSRQISTPFQWIMGGFFVGCGIGIMHYTGMAAMQMEALLSYDPQLFALSLLVAIVLAIFALRINFRVVQRQTASYWLDLLGASLMGLAISGMHYTAMAAANFTPLSTPAEPIHGLNSQLVAFIIITITLLVSLLVIVTIFAHKYYVISKALEKSQQVIENDKLFLESVLAAVSDPIFIKNRDHHLTMVNDACCKLLGRSREQLLGKNDRELFSSSTADRYFQIDEEVFSTKRAYITEEKYVDNNGVIHCIQTEATPYFSTLGEPLLVGVMRDITENKSNEQRLFRSEYLLKMAQEGSHIGYYVIDLETGLCESSESLIKILGLERNADTPFDIHIWHQLIHAEDCATVIERYHELISHQKKFSLQYRIVRPCDQEMRWVEVYGGFEYDDQTKPQGHLLGTLQDVTERKKIERELLELNQTLAMRVEQRTEELVQSEKMATLGQLIAGIAHEINSPLGAISSAANSVRHFLNDTLSRMPPLFHAFSDEECREFLVVLDRALNHNQRTLSAKDQRQNRLLLEKLLRDELPNGEVFADTLVDMGIYDDIHEIVPLLKKENGTEIADLLYKLSEMKKGTQTIYTATERASRIVLALKSYAHHDSLGKKVLANIADGIETVLILYHQQIKQGVELITHYAKNLPATYCFPDELNQIWTNLVQNALQAMDNQGTLTITVVEEQAQIKVSVQDSGKGIEPEYMNKIFDAFFTTKAVGIGSGLGLHIIRKIVDKHGGKITVASQPGCTIFSVFLPILQTGEE